MTEQQLNDLFNGIVCRKLSERSLEPFLDCDVYEFAISLDMSFEEIKALPLELWDDVINRDLEEFEQDVM
ncbi:hypothetical protein [Gibbsiella quercinecans]|uniref:hypothetical protein n=1 Tax=Gibbsiella quercinecans TaxID=929813 RepID=UPI002432338A|nr:hypothetical protein [Gibbsiella quercinecans]